MSDGIENRRYILHVYEPQCLQDHLSEPSQLPEKMGGKTHQDVSKINSRYTHAAARAFPLPYVIVSTNSNTMGALLRDEPGQIYRLLSHFSVVKAKRAIGKMKEKRAKESLQV